MMASCTCLVELVETLEETVQGNPVQPEQLETLCSQLLLFSSNTDTSLPVRWGLVRASWRGVLETGTPHLLLFTLAFLPITSSPKASYRHHSLFSLSIP